jgi:hypothetical protein
VAEQRRSDPVDLDAEARGLFEEPAAIGLRELLVAPGSDRCGRLVQALDRPVGHFAIRVTADEARVLEAGKRLDGLLGHRSPGDIAADDDEVDTGGVDLLEHGGERRQVAVYVIQRCDSHGARLTT